jgi:hypothetical protein
MWQAKGGLRPRHGVDLEEHLAAFVSDRDLKVRDFRRIGGARWTPLFAPTRVSRPAAKTKSSGHRTRPHIHSRTGVGINPGRPISP